MLSRLVMSAEVASYLESLKDIGKELTIETRKRNYRPYKVIKTTIITINTVSPITTMISTMTSHYQQHSHHHYHQLHRHYHQPAIFQYHNRTLIKYRRYQNRRT
ncbi:unnamed protein product [Absidia cylindrospora]